MSAIMSAIMSAFVLTIAALSVLGFTTVTALLPTIDWNASIDSAFGDRILASCASRLFIDANNVTRSYSYVYGGYSAVRGYLNDVYIIDSSTYKSTLLTNNGDGPGIGINAAFDVLANGNLVVYGGDEHSSTVYLSKDGQIWSVVTTNAQWSPRAPITHVVIPFTNTLVIPAGPADNITYINRDGIGLDWLVTGQMPLLSLDGAAGVAVNPLRQANASGVIVVIGGDVNTNSFAGTCNSVWTSTDLGVSWRFSQAVFAPRYRALAITDIAGNIYLTQGMSDQVQDYSIWFSPDAGVSWGGIKTVRTEPFYVFYACLAISYNTNKPNLLLVNGLLNNTNIYNGLSVGVINQQQTNKTSLFVVRQ